LLLGFEPTDDTVPEIPEAPSQADSFAGRPACQELFKVAWRGAIADQPADLAYRRLYYYLHKLVDQAVGRILDALAASGMADDTIVVFTSDHGDMLGAHGGMLQKWCNAYDETARVPLLVTGPGIVPVAGGISTPTSHVDLIPTLMGLAGIDVERAAAGVSAHHNEAHPLPGRDLSGLLTGSASEAAVARPIYFMTEDDVTRGSNQANILTGASFDAVEHPSNIEMVITGLPTGADGTQELWKLNHYYERLDEWNADHGIAPNPFASPAAEPVFELHNLSADPQERHNRAGDDPAVLSQLQSVLVAQRDEQRLVPRLRNP
jgi:arylsulfatase A-like enzyme